MKGMLRKIKFYCSGKLGLAGKSCYPGNAVSVFWLESHSESCCTQLMNPQNLWNMYGSYTALRDVPALAKENCNSSGTEDFPQSWSFFSWNLHSCVGPLGWHGLRKKRLLHSCLACFFHHKAHPGSVKKVCLGQYLTFASSQVSGTFLPCSNPVVILS